MKIQVKKLNANAKLPQKMSELAAGYDLYYSGKDALVIMPGTLELVSTGISIALPKGFEAQIRPRSGLAYKHKIGVLNSPGTIDADYRGEVKVILFNFGKTPFEVLPNTRIAQMVIAKHENCTFELTEELPETVRGSGGFGSTKTE